MRYNRPTRSVLPLVVLLSALLCHSTSTNAADFVITASPTGFTNNFSLSATVQVSQGDTGKNGALYVAANVAGTLYFLSQDGTTWNMWAGGPLPVYYAGGLGNHTIFVVNHLDVSTLPGVDIYVGYGLNEADMLNNSKFANIFTIPPPGPTLSAARDLVGTWKTAIPATVFFNTDWCTDELKLVASQPWDVTFKITQGQDDNHVDVEMDFTAGGFTVINGCPYTGIVPEVSPMFFPGVISSSKLLLHSGTRLVGEFNFTTDILTGTFDYTWSAVYTQEEYTATNSLILLRQ